MKKGFTLIELLAVIVILAIIALIATPIIIGIINNAREEARKRSAEAVTHAIEVGYTTAQMKNTGDITVLDIINNSKVDNEKERDYNSITTKDGVKCSLDGSESMNFTVTCIDTKSHNKEILTKDFIVNENTMIIYRYTEDVIFVGDSITPSTKDVWCYIHDDYNSCLTRHKTIYKSEQECLNNNIDPDDPDDVTICQQTTIQTGLSSGYETDPSNIEGRHYLKHVLVNNVIVKTYACERYSQGDLCLAGGSPSYYGTYDGISDTQIDSLEGLHPTGNLAIMDAFMQYGTKRFREDYSYGYRSTHYFEAYSTGKVIAGAEGSNIYGLCEVDEHGTSWCLFPL